MRNKSLRTLALAVGVFASLALLAFAAEVPQSAPKGAEV